MLIEGKHEVEIDWSHSGQQRMGITIHGVLVAGLCYLFHDMVSAGFNCTFDTDTCGWTQDQTESRDWIRNMGATGTPGTGPSYDHTSGQGHYMYIESPTAYTPGQKARLTSPSINGTDRMCLVFFYHMYGLHINTLNVYFSRSGILGTPVWTKLESQGSVWNRGTIQIEGGSTTASVTNIVFEALEGDFVVADIAIDDISLQVGTCPEEPYRAIRLISLLNNGIGRLEVYYNGNWGTVCDNGFTDQATMVACRQLGMLNSWSKPTTVSVETGSGSILLDRVHCNGNEASLAECDHSPWGSHSCSHSQDVGLNCDSEGLNCTFDINTCAWTQKIKSQVNWTRSASGISGNGNGPSSDHTSGHGSYMYIDTSYPHTEDRSARLFSPPIDGKPGACLVFYYYMFGVNVSSLNVYLNQIATPYKSLWTMTKSQGNMWKKAVVQIPKGSATSRLVVVAVRGLHYQGTIAIDDVSLISGRCYQEEPDFGEPDDGAPVNNLAAVVGGVVAVVVIAVVVAFIVCVYRRRRLESDITVRPQRMRENDGMINPICEQKNSNEDKVTVAANDETIQVQNNQNVGWSAQM